MVDLDGTLLRSDLLDETFAAAFFRNPLQTLLVVFRALLAGRARLKQALGRLGGVDVDALPLRPALELIIDHAFERFKRLADQKKEVYEEDLEVIISEEVAKISERFVLRALRVQSGTDQVPTATVELEIDGKSMTRTGTGDGPVDARA